MSATLTASPRLHRPEKGDTHPLVQEIRALVAPKNYPCVAALRSVFKEEYQVGLYGKFGRGECWRELRNDLLFFLAEQKQSQSSYLTFFAAFEPEEFTEESFEQALWRELSFLTSAEERGTDWAPGATQDPENPAFRFSLAGDEFFVVGLHNQSSRLARRFPRPALIFNVFAQFEQIAKLGQYEAMVATNRRRDVEFQGNVNPMVEAHGEQWETIQFSGKTNSSKWKCPFRFLHKAAKP